MAAKLSASKAPSSTAGLFKSSPSYTQPTANPARGSLQSGIPGISGAGLSDRAAQAAYGPVLQGTMGHSYRALEGGGYVNEMGDKVSGYTKPSTSKGGGGGGGGMIIPQQQAAPLDFFLGAAPEMKKLDIPLEDYTKMLGKVNNPEELAALTERYNAPTQKAFQSNLPFFDASMAALGGQALDALSGRVSRSTAQSIARSSAMSNLGSGLGGGGLGRNLTLRDFGRSSMDAVSQGADLFSRSVGLAQQKQAMASPISMANLMVNPAAIYDTLLTQAQSNQNIANANLMNAWQSQARPGQFDITTGKYVGYQPGQRTPYAPLTPEKQRDQDLKNKVADLNSRYGNRFSVRGTDIFDSYSGRKYNG
jgi:hypothetical protein